MINNDLQCHDVTGILYFSLKFLTKRQSLPSCTPPVPRRPSSGSRCRVPFVAASDLPLKQISAFHSAGQVQIRAFKKSVFVNLTFYALERTKIKLQALSYVQLRGVKPY